MDRSFGGPLTAHTENRREGRPRGGLRCVLRSFAGEIPGFRAADALALFRALPAGERGAYRTYAVHRPEHTPGGRFHPESVPTPDGASITAGLPAAVPETAAPRSA